MDTELTGERTLTGVSENSFDWRFSDGTVQYNYNVSAVYGLISVLPRDAKYEVHLVAKSDTVEYDGEEHSVEGFEETEFDIDNSRFTVEEISVGASGTEVGTYGTTLTGEAVVLDSDGADVSSEFAISYESGSLKITPKAAVDGGTDSDGSGDTGNDETAPDDQGDGSENGGDSTAGNGGSSAGGQSDGSGSSGSSTAGNGGSSAGDQPGGSGSSSNTGTTADENGNIISENLVPYSTAPSGYWALLNLIMTVITVLLGLFNILRKVFGKKDNDEEQSNEEHNDEETVRKYRLSAVAASAAAAVISVIAFVLTEDMTNTMAYTDRYTVLMAIILIAGLISSFFVKKKEDKEAQEDQGENQ